MCDMGQIGQALGSIFSPAAGGLKTGVDALGAGAGIYGQVANYLKTQEQEKLAKNPYKFYQQETAMETAARERGVKAQLASTGKADGNIAAGIMGESAAADTRARLQESLGAAGASGSALNAIPNASGAGLSNLMALAKDYQPGPQGAAVGNWTGKSDPGFAGMMQNGQFLSGQDTTGATENLSIPGGY